MTLRLEDITVSYGTTTAVDRLSLELQPGEAHVLLGHSGSGKTTTLRAVAGFERVKSGRIFIDDEQVDGDRFVPPEARRIGFVFQDYALFPHMSVARNIAFGMRSPDDAEIRRYLDLIELSDRGDSMPGELSGGEQQRVALARSLARDPRLVLLDEPFSNLDPLLRSGIRRQTYALIRQTGVASILVTHSAEEAMEVADRISVVRDGRLLQTGTPEELYQRPNSRAVATALGPANVLEAELAGGVVRCALGDVPRATVTGLPDDDAVGFVVVRPEDLEPAESGAGATVRSRSYLGSRSVLDMETGGVVMSVTIAPGAASPTHLVVGRAHWLDA